MEDCLARDTRLPFEIELADGGAIRTVGGFEAYLRSLNDHDRASSRWEIVSRMLANSLREPAYLKAATMSLQSALILEGRLVRMSTLDPRR